ncbi:MAG: TolC family protein [Proteobacteria bacterium]|nr:TolC family protein [Pseudomonadota bacterium]
MKNMRILISSLVVILIILLQLKTSDTAIAESASDQSYKLSLQSAIEKALGKNPMIDASQARMSASSERITQARSGFYPQIFASETYQKTTNPMWAFGMKLNQADIAQADFIPDRLNDPSAIDNFNTQIGLSWSVFNGGKSWHGLKQADMGYQASIADLDRTRQEIISQTVFAYTDLVYVSNCNSVVDQSLLTAKAHLKMIEDRYNNGLTVKSDLLRARVHIAELEQRQVDVKNQILVAEAALYSVLNEDVTSSLEPVTPLSEKKVPAKELAVWIDTAMTKRPDFLKMTWLEKMAQEEIKKSRSGHLPSLNIQGNYEINTPDFDETADNYTVGANVTVNLFSGLGISAQTREALYRHNEIKSQLRAMTLNIRFEIKQAYYMLQSASTRIHVADISIDEATEALRIVKDRYNNGQLSVVSLLDAELTLDRAKNNYYMALRDHMQARVKLDLASGTLDAAFQ